MIEPALWMNKKNHNICVINLSKNANKNEWMPLYSTRGWEYNPYNGKKLKDRDDSKVK